MTESDRRSTTVPTDEQQCLFDIHLYLNDLAPDSVGVRRGRQTGIIVAHQQSIFLKRSAVSEERRDTAQTWRAMERKRVLQLFDDLQVAIHKHDPATGDSLRRSLPLRLATMSVRFRIS